MRFSCRSDRQKPLESGADCRATVARAIEWPILSALSGQCLTVRSAMRWFPPNQRVPLERCKTGAVARVLGCGHAYSADDGDAWRSKLSDELRGLRFDRYDDYLKSAS